MLDGLVLAWVFPGADRYAAEYGDVAFVDATFKVSSAGYDLAELVLVTEDATQLCVGHALMYSEKERLNMRSALQFFSEMLPPLKEKLQTLFTDGG